MTTIRRVLVLAALCTGTALGPASMAVAQQNPNDGPTGDHGRVQLRHQHSPGRAGQCQQRAGVCL